MFRVGLVFVIFIFSSAHAFEFLLTQDAKDNHIPENFLVTDSSQDRSRMQNFEFYAIQRDVIDIDEQQSPGTTSNEDNSDSQGDKDQESNPESDNSNNFVDVPVYKFVQKSLKDMRNTIVIVNFWNTWSSDSIIELQQLDALVKTIAELELDNKIAILPIAITTKEQYEKISKLYSDYSITNLGIFVTEDKKLFDSLGIKVFPCSFIIDSSGYEVASALKPVKWTKPFIIEFIKSIIKKNDQPIIGQVVH